MVYRMLRISEDELWYFEAWQLQGCTYFQKESGIYLKILGARNITWSMFYTEDPQILGAALPTAVAPATWCPAFVRLFYTVTVINY
jgi:hypothetical protein